MKKFILLLALITSLNMLVGCSDSTTNSSGTDTTDNGDGGDGGTGDGGTVNNNTTPTTPANCTGTTADGTGDGTPIHQFRMMLSGHETWVPGDYTEALRSSIPRLVEASQLFQSDSRLKVRFKVNSQPYPTAGEEYCYGRQTGVFSDPYFYTKLKFRLQLRDIICSQINAQDPTQCDGDLSLGEPYRIQYFDPVSVGFCSPVIDLGAIRNTGNNIMATTVEVDDVKADSACQYNGSFCPAEKIVRKASCWDMTIQIVTDYTQDFKL